MLASRSDMRLLSKLFAFVSELGEGVNESILRLSFAQQKYKYFLVSIGITFQNRLLS
jgi:hypothetical protein